MESISGHAPELPHRGPGPFSYNRRLGRRKRRGSGGGNGGGGALVLGVIIGLVLLMLAIKYWYVTLPLAAVGALLAWYHFANLDPEGDPATPEDETP
ncbi:hypothetical protein ACQP04_28105 [Pseudonocardia halophobica]|uniref:hypothetical protein n=1 Tax=Pseudonocardia halophobica TaxID=29401 RepID=UPI003D931398